MNASNELNFKDLLRIRLDVLRREHRELDAAVKDMEASGRPDQLSLRRLKKQKLALKDQIVKIEDDMILRQLLSRCSYRWRGRTRLKLRQLCRARIFGALQRGGRVRFDLCKWHQ
jgi:hypothetical protein